MTEHALSAEPTHSVWDRSLPPRLRIEPGDEVQIECVDASGGQVHAGHDHGASISRIDRTRIHALTGPIWIEGAEPGDVLQIDVLATRHRGWGWTSVVEGLGFLKERFPRSYLFHWLLEGESTRSLASAVVPVRPFLGVMGVARADDGAFRTRPPGPFGGNLDVRELCAGSTLYLPVYNPRRAFQLRRRPRGSRRRRSLHQWHRVSAGCDAAFQPAQAPTARRTDCRSQRATPRPTPPQTPGSCRNRNRSGRSRARSDRPHDRPAGQPLGLQRDSRLPALQRRAQASAEPGGQRARSYRQRRISANRFFRLGSCFPFA